MADFLKLKVVTPLGLVVQADVADVVLPAERGELDILPGHTSYLTRLREGLLQYTADGTRETVVLSRGIAEVVDNRVTVITEKTRLPSEILPADLDQREKELLAAMEEAMDLGKPTGPILDEIQFLGLLRTVAR